MADKLVFPEGRRTGLIEGEKFLAIFDATLCRIRVVDTDPPWHLVNRKRRTEALLHCNSGRDVANASADLEGRMGKMPLRFGEAVGILRTFAATAEEYLTCHNPDGSWARVEGTVSHE